MSSLNIEGKGLKFIKDLLSHESFEYKNPNKIRSVLGHFKKKMFCYFMQMILLAIILYLNKLALLMKTILKLLQD